MSAYQAFVKSNSARIRRENPGLGLGEVMKRLGEEFREMKARNAAERGNVKENLKEIVEIDDVFEGDDSTDDVAKKLDFLRI